MKRPIFNVFASVALAAVLSSCNLVTFSGSAFESAQRYDSGSDTLLVYDVEDFSEIECYLPCSIEYSNDSVSVCELILPRGLSDYIEVACLDGVLEIGSADTKKFRNSSITISLRSSSVGRINISGAAEIDLAGEVVSDTLVVDVSGALDLDAGKVKANMVALSVSGAGDIDISQVECNSFYANVSGAANIRIAGKAGSADISVSGAGDIDVRQLDCADVKTNTYGIVKVRRK